jgi:hypothetical protein
VWHVLLVRRRGVVAPYASDGEIRAADDVTANPTARIDGAASAGVNGARRQAHLGNSAEEATR